MLCFQDQENIFGEICTVRCQKRKACQIQKMAFLIEAVDFLTYEIDSGTSEGIYVSEISPYCSAPEAYLNGAIDDYLPPKSNAHKLFKS